jgi:hypothetical protein
MRGCQPMINRRPSALRSMREYAAKLQDWCSASLAGSWTRTVHEPNALPERCDIPIADQRIVAVCPLGQVTLRPRPLRRIDAMQQRP